MSDYNKSRSHPENSIHDSIMEIGDTVFNQLIEKNINSNQTNYNPRIYIQLTAWWGNSDAQSSIRVSRRTWKHIKQGLVFTKRSTGWYEGQRQSVVWHFSSAELSINGEEDEQFVVCQPVEDLIVEIVESKQRKKYNNEV